MKKLLFLLLLPTLCIGQGRIWQRCGLPTTVPTGYSSYRDVLVDTCNGITYNYTALKWVENTGVKKALGGKDGQQGVQGIPGVSGGAMSFPFIVVIGTGNDDVQVNAAIALNRTTKKVIWFSGNVSTGTIIIPWDSFRLTMFGYGCSWTAKAGTTTLLKREQPTDNGMANIMTGARFVIVGFDFNGTTAMKCMELGASYMSEITSNHFNEWGTGIHNRFALSCDITNNQFYCMIGDIADMGNWTNASNSNSQSNNTRRTGNRYRLMVGATIGSASYAASGCVYQSNIFEWAKAVKVCEFDFKMSTVVKDVSFIDNHIESMYGNAGASSGEAYFWIRGVGTVNIDGVFSQYAGCLINASGEPAQLQLNISHINWAVPPPDGKLFYNGGGTRWNFIDNTTDVINSNITNKFAGVATTECGGTGCGNNKWTLRTFDYDTRSKFTGVAGRIAPEPQKPYQLLLVIKPEAMEQMHSQLRPLAQGEHLWYFNTQEEAQTFANANPDFNATITTNR